MKKKYLILIAVAALLVAAIIWTVWGNTTVGLTQVTLVEENLPYAFDGFRIAHVSDLHNSWLWEETIQQLKEADPDMIVITGDLVDANRTDMDTALKFIVEAVQIADCFYIPGNHESDLPAETYAQLVEGMRQYGVMILDNSEVRVHKNGSYISIVGLGWEEGQDLSQIGSFDGYRILLAHRPESFDEYAAAGFDLVFSGHAHGGQVRLPFVGGLYAPGQGIFPEYDSGVYSSGDTDMVVSRGIGNGRFQLRFNNRPEVVIVELRCE